MAIPQPASVRISRARINFLLLICCVVAALCSSQLFRIQVVRQSELARLAQEEIEREDILLPRRGTIRDSQGTVLAMNADLDSLWVTPRLIQDPEKLSLVLGPLLNKSVEEIYAGLTSQRRYLRLVRWLNPEVSEKIRALEEPGLHLVPEPKRVYPLNTFAAQIVGVTNWDGEGISGVEASNNAMLKGEAGVLRAERDPARRPLAIGPRFLQPPRDGANLTLTIDPTVQKIVEEELKAGIERNNASGGTIVVMDPQTGAILGMASWPLFDPNRYQDYPPEVYNRNPAIAELYEPGSTFKIVTIAAGLDSGAFTVDTLVNDTGTILRYGHALHNWDSGANGMIPPEKVLYYSSNVGALQFAEMIGPDRFYDYVRRFGYGEPTGVDLAGEQAGLVQWPDQEGWSPLVLDTNAYGQGISVTPLQHLRAISAIANGGQLMQPYTVKEWCYEEVCHEIKPRVIRRVVRQETTDLIRPMLVKSANTYARLMWLNQCGMVDVPLVPGYEVAAKTGTSQIPDARGGYETSATIGSVAGFAPAKNPRIAVLVKFDRPKDIYGVLTAIPVYQSVMARLLMYYRVPPDPALVADCQRASVGQGE
ncbi:MAG: peptidoglycan glycosyltransferase [Herpetosiphonaceae bacterium]|nr:MAG: peptidoglycan glycosyltransferase [Herpetosiphonaceae bacterium]